MEKIRFKKIKSKKVFLLVIFKELGINFKTVMKWRKRDHVSDLPFGSKKLRTVLTEIEEKAICIFRKTTNHSLDDCFIALKDTIPKLSRSNLHRCLKRNGLSVLFPYKIHRILTDNGAQFTYELLLKHLRPKNLHPFELLCKKHAIKHKLTKFRHPWTNGQVERINRTIKDATTKTYHYDSINQFEKHLHEFILVYNFAKRLKSLKFKTPFEFLAEKFKNKPTLFYQNPEHYSMGLNT